MTTDARRLMRLRAVAQGSNRAFRLHSNKAKWFGGRIFLSTAPRVNPQAKSQGWPYEGLSRMKGNFHVRFLEGGGLATARLYSATGDNRRQPASGCGEKEMRLLTSAATRMAGRGSGGGQGGFKPSRRPKPIKTGVC